MTGVVVRNGPVMQSFIRTLHEEGSDLDAVRPPWRYTHVRPVLMTTQEASPGFG